MDNEITLTMEPFGVSFYELYTEPFCGDGICNGDETCATCPADCGVCPNNPPTHSNPILNASDHPLNTTNATLTCNNVSTIDLDGDILTIGNLTLNIEETEMSIIEEDLTLLNNN
jgi:hypothetical protein